MRIRLARERDAELLPAIERSAGEAFRQVSGLAWIADEADQTVERYLEWIAMGTSWVAVDADDWPIGFLSAEILAGELHVWEFAVRLELQRFGHGTALLEHARSLIRSAERELLVAVWPAVALHPLPVAPVIVTVTPWDTAYWIELRDVVYVTLSPK